MKDIAMGAFDAIQPFSTLRLEPRSNLDPPVLQPLAIPAAEVLRERRGVDGAGGVTVAAAASIHPLTPAGLARAPTPPAASAVDIAMGAAEPGASGPRLAPPRSAAATTTMIQRSEVAEKAKEPPPEAKAPPLPYGPDPERVRQLIDWFVSRNEFLPVTFVYRQAGDLRETTPTRSSGKAVASARAVRALYQTD
jgi:hypothetical protein